MRAGIPSAVLRVEGLRSAGGGGGGGNWKCSHDEATVAE